MKVYIEITNHLGTFDGDILDLNEEQYAGLVQLAQNYYKEAEQGVGFETYLRDSSFVVFSPEIMRNSILVLRKIKEEENEKTD